ncbi:MAG: hypothetical protein NTZ98_15560 [Acidobacteria bacterium]|nr:hypothetical protein [Acidobacteriota bacterium]
MAMQTLRNSLAAALLVLGCLLGLQLSWLFAQAGMQLNRISEETCRTLHNVNRTLDRAQPSLTNIEQTTEELRDLLAPHSKSLARRLLEKIL